MATPKDSAIQLINRVSDNATWSDIMCELDVKQKIEWAESAEIDLSEKYEFIARDSVYYAELFIVRIIIATGMLVEHT